MSNLFLVPYFSDATIFFMSWEDEKEKSSILSWSKEARETSKHSSLEAPKCRLDASHYTTRVVISRDDDMGQYEIGVSLLHYTRVGFFLLFLSGRDWDFYQRIGFFRLMKFEKGREKCPGDGRKMHGGQIFIPWLRSLLLNIPFLVCTLWLSMGSTFTDRVKINYSRQKDESKVWFFIFFASALGARI